MGIYELHFGGGSYSSIYVPPPMCMFDNPCSVYSCGICLSFDPIIFCMPISLFTQPLVLLSTNCVKFIHDWTKTFGGCMHMCFTICSYMCVLKYVYII